MKSELSDSRQTKRKKTRTKTKLKILKKKKNNPARGFQNHSYTKAQDGERARCVRYIKKRVKKIYGAMAAMAITAT